MEIKHIDSYRDGGTIGVTLHDGREFYVDRSIDTKTPNAIYPAYPMPGHTMEPIEDEGGVLATYFAAILLARNAYKNARGEQRAGISPGPEALEQYDAHREADIVSPRRKKAVQ